MSSDFHTKQDTRTSRNEQGNHTMITLIYPLFRMYFVCIFYYFLCLSFLFFFFGIFVPRSHHYNWRRKDIYIGGNLGSNWEGKGENRDSNLTLNLNFLPPKDGKKLLLVPYFNRDPLKSGCREAVGAVGRVW